MNDPDIHIFVYAADEEYDAILSCFANHGKVTRLSESSEHGNGVFQQDSVLFIDLTMQGGRRFYASVMRRESSAGMVIGIAGPESMEEIMTRTHGNMIDFLPKPITPISVKMIHRRIGYILDLHRRIRKLESGKNSGSQKRTMEQAVRDGYQQ